MERVFSAIAVAAAVLLSTPGRAQTDAPTSGQKAASGLVTPEVLPHHLRGLVQYAGDRQTVAGKERAVLVGTLGWAKTSRGPGSIPVQIALELGDKLLVETQDGKARGSDGSQLWGGDDDLLETLLNDALEHLAWRAVQNSALVFVGSRIRFDDLAKAGAKAPYFDVYALADTVLQTGKPTQRWRTYCFNSDSALLERVQYQVEQSGRAVKVETVLADWKRFAGQYVPTTVTRTEDGVTIFTLTVHSVVYSAQASDNRFKAKP